MVLELLLELNELSELKGKIAEVKIKEEKGTLTKTASGGFSGWLHTCGVDRVLYYRGQ